MNNHSKTLISIVIPVYNEEENVELCYHQINKILMSISKKYEFEFIFTDNHSTDNTFNKLKDLTEVDKRIRVIRFSRNFGFQRSILTGYLAAKGDAAIQLDCDLQDPPELINDFIAKWEEGYKVVYGIRISRKEGKFITALRKIFYRLIDILSDTNIPHDAGDFRIIDRCIIDVLAKTQDMRPYIRGMISSIGFKQIGIPYERAARKHGQSKFSFKHLFQLAIDGITNHSIVPLRFATYTGLLISLITFLGVVSYVIGQFFFGKHWPAGFATTTALILTSLSLNALFLGIIGEYLGRIYLQTKPSPLTIIEQEIKKS